MDVDKEEPKPHACEVRVSFPTNLQAEQAMQVLQVDPEPTDRVSKSFRLENDPDDNQVTMVVYASFLSSDCLLSGNFSLPPTHSILVHYFIIIWQPLRIERTQNDSRRCFLFL
jgi:hypothetical protein